MLFKSNRVFFFFHKNSHIIAIDPNRIRIAFRSHFHAGSSRRRRSFAVSLCANFTRCVRVGGTEENIKKYKIFRNELLMRESINRRSSTVSRNLQEKGLRRCVGISAKAAGPDIFVIVFFFRLPSVFSRFFTPELGGGRAGIIRVLICTKRSCVSLRNG